jgi:chromosome segregation ATPase
LFCADRPYFSIAKIKYPPDPPRNTALPAPQNTVEPPESHIREPVTRVVDEDQTDRGSPDQSLPSSKGPGPATNSPDLSVPNESRPESLPVHLDPQDAGLPSNHDAARTAPPPPVRPRRADDDTFTHNTTVTRSVSPSGRIPDGSDGDDARSGPYNGTGVNLLPNSPMAGDANKRSHTGQTAKEPPADAFYYGSRSPTGTVFSTRGETPVQQYPRNIDTHDLTRVVRENTVLRAALEKVSDGEFGEAVPVASSSEEDSASSEMLLDHILQLQEDCSRLKVFAHNSLLFMCVALNEILLQVEMVERVEIAFEELGDAERQRDAALQETAYFKARLAILEHESSAELSELDREKIMELEDHLASTQQGKQTLEAQVRELETTLHRITDDLDTWKAEGHTASERAQLAEEGQADLRLELNTAQNRTNQLEVQLREQMAENAANTSLLQQRDLDIESHRTQRDDLHQERSGHLLVIEEIRSALQDAERRSEDLSFKHESAARRAQELEQELQKLQVELAEQKRVADKAVERAAEADTTLQSTKGQVEHYRSLTERGLSQLFSADRTAERSLGTDRGEHPEKSAALAQECASLRKMLNEAGTQIEAAQTNLMRHRQDLQESRSATVKLHNELRGCQKQRNLDSETISQLRAMTASRNGEHQKLREEISRLQSRCDLLRRLLSDHGISASDEQAEPFLTSASTSDTHTHTQEQARSLEAAKLELEQLRKLLREKQGDKDRQEQASASGTDGFGNHPADPAARPAEVRDLEMRMTEMELVHKKKLQQVEADYQTAVKYVKSVGLRRLAQQGYLERETDICSFIRGTEKVFRRMKVRLVMVDLASKSKLKLHVILQDELTKQKSANAALQSELDAAQGTDGREAGSRTRSALSGRATPTTEGETPRQQQRLASQNADLQRQLEGLREELSALRDVCAGREKEVEITRRRAGEAEAQLEQTRKELERYQGEDTAARTMAEVEQENADLRQENETLNHQVMLLLADDDTTSPRPRSDVDFAKYNRRRSTSSTQGSDEQSRILAE